MLASRCTKPQHNTSRFAFQVCSILYIVSCTCTVYFDSLIIIVYILFVSTLTHARTYEHLTTHLQHNSKTTPPLTYHFLDFVTPRLLPPTSICTTIVSRESKLNSRQPSLDLYTNILHLPVHLLHHLTSTILVTDHLPRNVFVSLLRESSHDLTKI